MSMSVKRLLTALIVAVAVFATAATSASARPIDAVGTVASISGPSTYTGYDTSPHVTASSEPQSGFDWGDAAIGAAATFAVMIIAHGAVVLGTGRRQRRRGRAATA
jgi:hypothetical protein